MIRRIFRLFTRKARPPRKPLPPPEPPLDPVEQHKRYVWGTGKQERAFSRKEWLRRKRRLQMARESRRRNR